MFIDPSGADTLNYKGSIDSAKYTQAMTQLNKSETFRNFFQSFVDGENSSMTLEFQAVDDLKSIDTGAGVEGQALLMFRGKSLMEIGAIPDDAIMGDFSLLVQIRTGWDKDQSSDEQHAFKGVTMAHELFVHILADVQLINSENADGDFNGAALYESYISGLEDDHEELYTGKKTVFMKVSKEVVAAQNEASTNLVTYTTDPSIKKVFEDKYGKMKLLIEGGKVVGLKWNYKQLWEMTFDSNMARPRVIKKIKTKD